MLSNFGTKKPEKDAAAVETPARTNPLTGGGPGAPRPMAQQGRPNAGPAVVTRPAERSAASIIGPDLTIMGNLISSGEVQVDGEVQGDLHGTHVVIGEGAKITGGVLAKEIIVRGHVMGSIRGQKVMLQSSSHVEGDVYHESLSIEQGAYFEGKSRRSENPLSDVQRPTPNGQAPTPNV